MEFMCICIRDTSRCDFTICRSFFRRSIQRICRYDSYSEHVITKPKQRTIYLANVIIQQGKLFNPLFSGSQQSVLIQRMENNIKAHIFKRFPQYQSDIEKELLLTFTIYTTTRHNCLNGTNQVFSPSPLFSSVLCQTPLCSQSPHDYSQ